MSSDGEQVLSTSVERQRRLDAEAHEEVTRTAHPPRRRARSPRHGAPCRRRRRPGCRPTTVVGLAHDALRRRTSRTCRGSPGPSPRTCRRAPTVMTVPNMLRRTLCTSPVPPHVRHATGAVPGSRAVAQASGARDEPLDLEVPADAEHRLAERQRDPDRRGLPRAGCARAVPVDAPRPRRTRRRRTGRRCPGCRRTLGPGARRWCRRCRSAGASRDPRGSRRPPRSP